MTTIPEVMDETDGMAALDADLMQYFDIDGAMVPNVMGPESNSLGDAADIHGPACPSNPGNDDCLWGDWDLPGAIADAGEPGLEAADYSKFEQWIPRFIRPEVPCDYCRSKHLDCYMRRGIRSCNPCNSLFRGCSLSHTLGEDLSGVNAFDAPAETFLDTLHVVDEDACRDQGTLTGTKPLRSMGGRFGTTTPPVRGDDAPGSSKRNGIRFPRTAVKILRDWLDAHSDHPYPTEREKEELEKATGLKGVQIANWLANARRRGKATRLRPKRAASPSLRPSTAAIDIPGANNDKAWDELNPLERWQHSPPENEPASVSAIANAVAQSEFGDEQESRSPSSFGGRGRRAGSSNGSGFSGLRPPSTTSIETGSDSISAASSAAFSHGSHGSFSSFSSSLAGKKDRRRRRRTAVVPNRKPSDDKKRTFQCTFCTDTFKSKYDWTRHEKSLHLSLEKWICAPLGPVITDESGHKKCVYCGAVDVENDHGETHNHRQCEDKGIDARTFYRKDHLRQHMRLMHNCEMVPSMDNWKSVAININSRCGFCAQRFTNWQVRVDHLTTHFKNGAKMKDWKGCRGLDPAVAAQVTNAMPPYLIGMEAVSPYPYSATNESSWRQHNFWMDTSSEQPSNPLPATGLAGAQTAAEKLNDLNTCTATRERHERDAGGFASTHVTCWEILTVRLGQYANEQSEKGIVVTDEMLQSKARIILYNSDDSWNQTAADNPEWLDLFKKAHGLDYIPNAVGGQGLEVPEDLETYGDLGLRIPFHVQLERGGAFSENNYVMPQAYQKVVDQRKKSELGTIFQQLSKGQLSPEEQKRLAKEKGLKALFDADVRMDSTEIEKTLQSEGTPSGEAAYRARYTYELPPDRAQRFATITAASHEAGVLGEQIDTTAPDFRPADGDTTGAMMEFLGGTVGQSLPFSHDAASSAIPPLSSKWVCWSEPMATQPTIDEGVCDENGMWRDGNFQWSPCANAQADLNAGGLPSTAENEVTDFAMNDFDLESMKFDGVFDMPLDDTFTFVGDTSGA